MVEVADYGEGKRTGWTQTQEVEINTRRRRSIIGGGDQYPNDTSKGT